MNQESLHFDTSRLSVPLAERARPQQFENFIGQREWLEERGILQDLREGRPPPSLILWGPPGSGKTTLARLIAHTCSLPFVSLSAVTASIKEAKELMGEAVKHHGATGRPTLLFIDEIHRFNRAQQDAFLPFVEAGQIILIGTTTENPSFEINSALLSRVHVLRFLPLSVEQLVHILKHARDSDSQLSSVHGRISDEALEGMAAVAEGDARKALNNLEMVARHLQRSPKTPVVLREHLSKILAKSLPQYDKNRDQHYDFISALHKSMRNSDVQASLYWLARMIEGGEDPLYIARRVVRFASEDIGLAAPEILRYCLDAKDAVDFIGLPEGELALAQAVVACAVAPKSNALYTAVNQIHADLEKGHRYPVPMHIRNAVTQLMKEHGYGAGYKYAHSEGTKTSDMQCLPNELKDRKYYQPTQSGAETKIQARMDAWENLRKQKD
jgi:putative ATPase